MIDFIFNVDTKIFFGKNQLEKLPEEIKKYGNKVLLSYGGGSIKKSGLYDKLTKLMKDAGIEIFDFEGIEPNPRLATAKKGLQLAKDNKVDLILAVGGGSVIDASKLIAASYYTDADPWDIVIGKAKVEKALPVAAVLTIAATGSEMDTASVITNVDTREKLGWASPLVRPRFSFLDPELTYTLPPKQTSAGVADIMSHTMENYFSVDDSAYLQDSMAEGILRTLVKYGPIALREPENYDARANIMWANSWAINGLLSAGKSHDWSVHGMEHELSAYYDIPHGIGLAILTPPWLKYCLNEKTAPKIARFGHRVFDLEDTGNTMADADKAIKTLHNFFKNSMEIPMTLREVGIDDTALEEMAEAAAKHKDNEIDGFVKLGATDILEIYRAAW